MEQLTTNHSKNYVQQLENQTLQYNLKKFIAVAFERTGTEPYDVTKMINDLTSEFPFLSENDFKEIIRKGALAEYGKVYKLTTCEISFWTRKYLKDKENKQYTFNEIRNIIKKDDEYFLNIIDVFRFKHSDIKKIVEKHFKILSISGINYISIIEFKKTLYSTFLNEKITNDKEHQKNVGKL